MTEWQLKTPVAFIIFKRPDTTQRVFEMIRQAKPPKLLVVSDGPRADREGEAEKCAETRAILDQVDWDCEILKNYSDVNLGCGRRVSSGLTWVFNTVEEAIVLEDDCLPDLSFFRFCEELLERHRHDHRIVAISGQNVQMGRKRFDSSYYFSRYNHCWGWASWRRAWQYYDFNMKLWPLVRDQNLLLDMLAGDSHAVKVWTKVFQRTYDGKVDTWDYQWTFSCWVQSGLTILSNVNLVANIGFDSPDATRKTGKLSFNSLPSESLEFPLKHPEVVIRDHLADHFTQNTVYDYLPRLGNFPKRLRMKIEKTFNQIRGLFQNTV